MYISLLIILIKYSHKSFVKQWKNTENNVFTAQRNEIQPQVHEQNGHTNRAIRVFFIAFANKLFHFLKKKNCWFTLMWYFLCLQSVMCF